MEGTINANVQQIADCLRTYNSWGTNHVVNICTDKTIHIPWGIDDWMVCLFFIMFLTACFIWLCILIKSFFD